MSAFNGFKRHFENERFWNDSVVLDDKLTSDFIYGSTLAALARLVFRRPSETNVRFFQSYYVCQIWNLLYVRIFEDSCCRVIDQKTKQNLQESTVKNVFGLYELSRKASLLIYEMHNAIGDFHGVSAECILLRTEVPTSPSATFDICCILRPATPCQELRCFRAHCPVSLVPISFAWSFAAPNLRKPCVLPSFCVLLFETWQIQSCPRDCSRIPLERIW